jgi:hypothetical protein
MPGYGLLGFFLLLLGAVLCLSSVAGGSLVSFFCCWGQSCVFLLLRLRCRDTHPFDRERSPAAAPGITNEGCRTPSGSLETNFYIILAQFYVRLIKF